MRNVSRIAIVALLGLPLMGCSLMVYPAARAFGGMKESELKKCRAAFAVMKEEIRTSTVMVYPLLVVKGGVPSWDAVGARQLSAILESENHLAASVAPQKPGVPFEPMKRNQLRYLNERTLAYAAWTRAQPRAGDYCWFSEIFMDAHGDQVYAIHIYVVDAEGAIPYARLANSHHFGPTPVREVSGALRFTVKRFFKDLAEDPLRIWPKYGVG